jgi:hypothetical protein
MESFLSKAPKWAISNSPACIAERSQSNAQTCISECYESHEWAQAKYYDFMDTH